MRRILGLFVAGLVAITLAACSGGGASKASFCSTLQDAKNAGQDLVKTFTTSDPKKLDSANALVHKLQSKAPKEIKADMKTLADFTNEIVPDLKSAGGDLSKLEALAPKYAADEAKVTQALDNVEKYAKAQCGISLTAASSSSSKSSASSSPSESESSSSSSSSGSSFDSDSFNSSYGSYLSSLSSEFSDFSSSS